jgi:hypothetical protein
MPKARRQRLSWARIKPSNSSHIALKAYVGHYTFSHILIVKEHLKNRQMAVAQKAKMAI